MENKVLAVVNGREITERDLSVAISAFPRERQQFFMSEQGRKQLLDEIVSFELIYNEAVDNNLSEYKDYLAQVEMMKKELLTQAAIRKLLDEIKITDEQAKEYYEANKHMFSNKESVSAKHILVDSEEKAKEVKVEIEKGKEFEAAAAEYSSCPSKAQGGSLGYFTRGQMVPEFEDAAFIQEIGVVGEPVKTQFGYHLIKVEDKKEASIKPFEEVSSSIVNNLVQQEQSRKYAEHTAELRKKYNVLVNI
ncbi:MAG: peptidylprolyl isomerase [Bacillota bacterium]|nr:peptidylprolyl isomerase [Bacillota bacterium]